MNKQNNYYQDIITQKSWRILQKLKKSIDFVLIGGWAVWLYSKSLKSKDIDIIVDYQSLSLLKRKFAIMKNERLKKYEAKVEGIDIDIYLPYYSNPGLPAELVQKHRLSKEGFPVPKPEILLLLKQSVYEQRKASIKGQKDKLDIFSLLARVELDFNFYQQMLRDTRQEGLAFKLKELLQKTVRVKELNLKNHQMAKLKQKILSRLSPKSSV